MPESLPSRPMSKPPKHIAKEALEVERRSLPAYSATHSPRVFTQHQLLAISSLRQFFRKDSAASLRSWRTPQICAEFLGSIACPTSRRYGMQSYGYQKWAFIPSLTGVVQRAKSIGLLPARSRAAIDATGMESRHVSSYYVWRSGQRRHQRFHWPKLTVICDIESHPLPAAFVCMGPCHNSPQLPPVVRQAVTNHPID